jgi:DNA helicase-2/ATP-dependent DNA helicase PcrA
MLSQLNHQQKEAVTCGLGPVVVIAGAGTGKTTVLISRVVHLVNECHIPLAKILAITFTNKAANEMKTRINQVFPQININTFRTIHGLCNYILQQDIHYLKRLRFTIIDTNDQKSIINDIIKTLVNSEKIQAQDKRIHTAVFKFINQVKVLQLSFDDVAKD